MRAEKNRIFDDGSHRNLEKLEKEDMGFFPKLHLAAIKVK